MQNINKAVNFIKSNELVLLAISISFFLVSAIYTANYWNSDSFNDLE